MHLYLLEVYYLISKNALHFLSDIRAVHIVVPVAFDSVNLFLGKDVSFHKKYMFRKVKFRILK